MKEQIAKLVDSIVADYGNWVSKANFDRHEKLVAEFREKISVRSGRKYIKIVAEGSVWDFVVAKADDKFKEGDILKAASWAQPARNAARGNIFEDYSVAWTGPHYL